MVRKAIGAGLLVETRSKFGRRVTAQSVNRFRTERLILGRFARQQRTSRDKLELVCQDLGIEMLSLSKGRGEGELLVVPRACEQDIILALRIRLQTQKPVRETRADREERCAARLCRYVQELRALESFSPGATALSVLSRSLRNVSSVTALGKTMRGSKSCFKKPIRKNAVLKVWKEGVLRLIFAVICGNWLSGMNLCLCD